MSRRSAALSVVVVLSLALAASACARSHERKAAPTVRAGADHGVAPAAVSPDPSDDDDDSEAVQAAVDPLAGITGDASVGFPGDDRLLAEALAADLEVPAFDVACVRAEDALRAPATVDARFQNFAEEQHVALGRVRFVRLEQDPRIHTGRAEPRLCRPVREDAELYAPLFRVREPASTWLVEREQKDVGAAVRVLVERAAKQGAKAAGPPRAVVVRGEIVAVALPIVSG